MVKSELDAGRPVQYAGMGREGGHSFVCYGYKTDGYFHFNWGWGGKLYGYFKLTALNPIDKDSQWRPSRIQ
ncbi:C10 family peptidase [Porphyromonas pogonae]|uniref:C10 family peptidase n=1 Tax=Porphyromonas pogonae TaxID=867595 RepID=UPI002E77B123|nr:C10 family peptidase [Porphyromonas pogonae]